MLGGFQWIAFEHRGEAVWPRICSISGAIDIFLQKKDAFYQNKSMWTDEPMIHMLPHWNFAGLEGEEIVVTAYTNCEEAELILNGRSLGKKAVERFTALKWNVKYEPGEIKVIGYNNGGGVCEDGHITSGAAARLILKAENEACANSKDVLIVSCTCIDENGIEVPDAEPFVHFFANETAQIVGTGSSNIDHVPPHIPDRRMYAGRISIALRLVKHGKLKLYARADGLASAVLELDV